MNQPPSTSRLAATALVAAGLLVMVIASTRLPASTAPQLGNGPVVVELFTSQGCSSCPPADTLLRTIARDPSLRSKVIPLAFHVDYWNHLGWRDPFSARAWSARQAEYVRALQLPSAYTPQAIVNGSKQMVGSDERAVWGAIVDESRTVPSMVRVTWSDRDHVVVTAESERKGGDVMLAVYENNVSTSVQRGENGGRMLVNDAIVRDFRRLGTLNGSTKFEKTVSLTLDQAWKHADLGVVAFVQDPQSLHIHGAAVAVAR